MTLSTCTLIGIVFCTVLQRMSGERRVAEVSEGEVMFLTCNGSEVIDIISVKYGRGRSWIPCENTQQSRSVVDKLCQYRTNCSLTASDDVFEDDCRFSFERLRVEFQCVLASTEHTTAVLLNVSTASTEHTTTEQLNVTEIPENSTTKDTQDISTALTRSIGIGIGLVCAVIAGILAVLIYRKMKSKRWKGNPEHNSNSNSSQRPLVDDMLLNGQIHDYAVLEPVLNKNSVMMPHEEGEEVFKRQSSVNPYDITYSGFDDNEFIPENNYSQVGSDIYNVLHETCHTHVDSADVYDTAQGAEN